jgi:hypothetical protein
VLLLLHLLPGEGPGGGTFRVGARPSRWPPSQWYLARNIMLCVSRRFFGIELKGDGGGRLAEDCRSSVTSTYVPMYPRFPLPLAHLGRGAAASGR